MGIFEIINKMGRLMIVLAQHLAPKYTYKPVAAQATATSSEQPEGEEYYDDYEKEIDRMYALHKLK